MLVFIVILFMFVAFPNCAFYEPCLHQHGPSNAWVPALQISLHVSKSMHYLVQEQQCASSFTLPSSLHVCLLSYFSYLFCFHFTSAFSFFLSLLYFTHRLASHEIVFGSRDKLTGSKGKCIAINIWLFFVLSLYEGLALFSQRCLDEKYTLFRVNIGENTNLAI